MKRLTFPFLLIALPLTGSASEFQQRIAFERDDFVWVANRDGTDAKKIAVGSFPSISPDAKRVVFTTTEKTGNTYNRHIAVADVATGMTSRFNEVPSKNVYYATWSPDGKRILFTLRVNEVWDLGVIDADGANFRTIKKGRRIR